MGDWLLNLPVIWMALVIFAGTYAMTAIVYLVVTRLGVNERAQAFRSLSPGMLTSLALIFGLLVGFIASQVWGDFEKAKVAVVTEASGLRAVLLFADSFPAEKEQIRSLLGAHIDQAANEEWPEMSRQQATLTSLPVKLIEALQTTLALQPADEGQKTAQREMIGALENAFEARRQRIILSQSTVSKIKWAGLLLQALCTLVAIAMVHVDNRAASAIGLALFATGVAISILLIGCYSRPFTGEISIGPELLQQAIDSDTRTQPHR